MLQRILVASIQLIALLSSACADVQSYNQRMPSILSLKEVGLFTGDQHGNFAGDPVATLSDGSQWKVHPTDSIRFSYWEIDDSIALRVRTSFYWFKREHKFELYNQTRQEAVKAMLVQYPTEPLFVLAVNTFKSGEKLVPRHWQDANGGSHVTYYKTDLLETKVLLSDGSLWTLKDDKFPFPTGSKVYLGANEDTKGIWFFLINGIEREAIWTWVNW